jgi:histone acetyltransferase 1
MSVYNNNNNILKTAYNGNSSSSTTDQHSKTLSCNKKDLEPTAGLSSAAACIHFHNNNSNRKKNAKNNKSSYFCFSFKPVYTHQIFDSHEVIRGYQPYPEAQQESLDVANKFIEKMNTTNTNTTTTTTNSHEESSSSSSSLRNHDIWNIPHSSFQHKYHIHAKTYLDIQIQLAPSCTKCNLILSYTDIPNHKERTSLKDKESADTGTGTGTVNSGNKRKISTILHEVDGNNNNNNNIDKDSILQLDDIVKLMSKGLPTIQNIQKMKHDSLSLYNKNNIGTGIDDDVFVDDDDDSCLTSPIGTPLFEYPHPNTKNNENDTFILCFANGIDEKVSDYHNQVQKLSLWFIENADDVDLTSDEGGGSWKVLYLFHKQYSRQKNSQNGHVHKDGENEDEDNRHDNDNEEGKSTHKNEKYKYSLVGYVTLFAFYSPFKKPKPGIVLRICQALILPPYQRCGHGKVFIRAVYDYANGKFDDKLLQQSTSPSSTSTSLEVVEVNVEDPAPSFEALRNCVDYEVFHENYKSSSTSITSPIINNGHVNDNDGCVQQHSLFLPLKYYNNTFLEPIRDNDAIQAASKARISKAQVHIAYEIFKLHTISTLIENVKDTTTSLSSKNNIEEIEKSYRLMVKKRLNQYHREEIGACPTKDAKKKKLGELYDDTVQKYRKILSSLSRHNK